MFSGIVATQLRKGKFSAMALADEGDIYCRCTTPYILTGEATVEDAIQPDSMAGDYGVEVVHQKAVKIDTRKRQVTTDRGNVFGYDYLVIATGASPWKPKIPGIDGKNIHTMRTSEDVRSVEALVSAAKSAVVIGAGVIGIEMAGSLRQRGLEIDLIEYASGISRNIASAEYADKIIRHLEEGGVRVRFGCEAVGITDSSDGRKEIAVREGDDVRTIEADVVIVATGVRPNLEIVDGTKIRHDERGIYVDAGMRTNVKDVYACGDCCLPVFSPTGESRPSQLASSAIQQAKIVGFHIAGYPIDYTGSTGAFAFRTMGREFSLVGLSEEEARKRFSWVTVGRCETTDTYKDLKTARSLELKLIFAGPTMRLVGYEAFGNGVIASAEVASLAIGLRLGILKLLRFNYIAHPSLTPWPFMNPIVMASEDAMNAIMGNVRKFLPFA